MFESRITKGKRVKIRSISAFKPNTPLLQHFYTLHVGITQIATDIPITNSLDSHPACCVSIFSEKIHEIQ
jgi:hypothetical protein